MPVMACQKDGASGFKWGSSGVCFTGEHARERAEAVGRAVRARKDEKGEELTHAEILKVEEQVTALDAEQFAVAAGILGVQIQKTEVEETPRRHRAMVKKTDEEHRIAWAEVYIPDLPDAHGDFMEAIEVAKTAWRYCASGRTQKCDVRHDNKTDRGMAVVETFVARDPDPDFIPGAWVVGMHIPGDAEWAGVQKGEFNGFSMQARVYQEEVVIDVDLEGRVFKGDTQPGGRGEELHGHGFQVRFDLEGKFLGGETTESTGPGPKHKHEIVRGSVTKAALDHTHRYSFLDSLFGG